MRTSTLFSAFVLVTATSLCHADDFSFTGTFQTVNDVQQFVFTVGAGSNVVLRSYSYAGGTDAAGTVIAEGGFDPILALFRGIGSTAVEIGQNDDGGSAVPADSVTGARYDTYLAVSGLTPGMYTATIQDYANFAVGPTLGNGFSNGGLTGGVFLDATGHNRDDHWAFDVLGVDSATAPGMPVMPPTSAVPEPSSLALLATGTLGVVGALRRRLRR